MAKVYWSRSDFAEYIGVNPHSLAAPHYDLPEPDVYIGTKGRRIAGWLPSTVQAWYKARPGRGRRTDLERKKQTP